MNRKPVLTLLKSNTIYDFSGAIGHRKEINSLMQKKLEHINDEQTKVLTKTKIELDYQKSKCR